MTERKALNIALEALNDMACWKEGREVDMGFDEPYAADTSRKAITAIKEALAQPEQECKSPEPEARRPDVHCPDQTCGFLGECRLGYKPEQEPVAWRYKILDYFGRPVWTFKTPKTDIRVFESQPLYTTPPQRKPLTDEEIILIVAECASSHQHTDIHLARAIEAAHQIYEVKK